MKVVIGLGNPGAKYDGTRHNVGFEVLGELARRHGASSPTEKFEAEVTEIFYGGEKVILLAPLTYMNLSGRSVRKCFDSFHPELEDLVVVCDDINLDVGRLRWRRKGSAGAVRMGVEHGAYCVGCCWLLMSLLFVVGVMNLVWVAALAGFVLLEKLVPRGEAVARISGIALLFFAAYLGVAAARP